MDTHPQAIPLASTLVKPAAEVMARAFYEDPFFTYVLPDSVQRGRVIVWLFERLILYGQHYGKVYTTPSIEGIAMWMEPDSIDLGVAGILKTGLFWLPFKMGWQAFRRSMSMVNCADQMHRRLITGPHWYLYELGVDPAWRRKGVGSALLQPILARADGGGLACYLETNNESNLRFYESNGFRLAGKEQASPGSPFVWGMMRKPGA